MLKRTLAYPSSSWVRQTYDVNMDRSCEVDPSAFMNNTRQDNVLKLALIPNCSAFQAVATVLAMQEQQ